MDKPNILYIMTDQQSAHMMSCTGTDWVQTPNMDRLAERGIRFERAYCSNPVCIPSRFSLFTGMPPEAMGMRSNDFRYLPPCDKAITENGMGSIFKKGGYDCFYGGKQHLPGFTAGDIGFDVIETDRRGGLAKTTADFLEKEHGKPWLFVASFINPHDICYKALGDFWKASGKPIEELEKIEDYRILSAYDSLPENLDEDTFYSKVCPPLPENSRPQENSPEILDDFRRQRGFKQYAADTYTDNDWRMHRWIYKKLTELVDEHIGVVLDALEKSRYADNTVVVFTSDHGDMDGSHGFEHKTLMYEEAIKVPLIISHRDKLPAGLTTDILVSNGLDLYPSLLEYAGLDVPDTFEYVNCIDAALGKAPKREYVPIEGEIGRAIVAEKYKYALYDFGVNKEQLYDLVSDPGEMKNHIAGEGLGDLPDTMRNRFRSNWSDEQCNRNVSPLLITQFK